MSEVLSRASMLTGLACGHMRCQMRRWRTSIRWELRFAAQLTCWGIAVLPVYLFSQLPAGWLGALLANLATPQGARLAFCLTTIAGMGLAYRIIGRKLEQSLFD